MLSNSYRYYVSRKRLMQVKEWKSAQNICEEKAFNANERNIVNCVVLIWDRQNMFKSEAYLMIMTIKREAWEVNAS